APPVPPVPAVATMPPAMPLVLLVLPPPSPPLLELVEEATSVSADDVEDECMDETPVAVVPDLDPEPPEGWVDVLPAPVPPAAGPGSPIRRPRRPRRAPRRAPSRGGDRHAGGSRSTSSASRTSYVTTKLSDFSVTRKRPPGRRPWATPRRSRGVWGVGVAVAA